MTTSMAGESRKRVAIIGAGVMGAGIAHAFLGAEWDVTLIEVDDTRRSRVGNQIREMFERRAGKGEISPSAVDTLMANLSLRTQLTELSESHLVIEAVPETVDLKVAVLTAAEREVGHDTAIASNTSSISINELANALERPGNFVGMHFFNPVPASLVVEIVLGEATKAPIVGLAEAAIDSIGKESVIVRDSPGFASSRLGVLLGLEAIRMLEEDVASAADIDRVMCLGYRHPMGPLHLTDLVGLDVRLGISEYLQRHLGDRFAPPDLLKAKVAAGELGRKVGKGFFLYEK